MVKIAPFQGFRYNKDKIGDFKSVVSPPYDVINSELQRQLHGKSDYNIAHIIKGKKFLEDDNDSNEYTRAAQLLDDWIAQGVLRKDDVPSIYVLAQDFETQGHHMTRAGFIALLRIEDMCTSKDAKGACFGVHQHEETLPKDIEDRLNLLRATKANFGLIFSIYTDTEKIIDGILEKKMQEEPVLIITDDDGITHRLWTISDENLILRIQEVMSNRFIIIADGHHRYKTALQYSKEHPETEGAQFRMLAFVNTMIEGLVILPTHRLVQGVEGFDENELLEKLTENFTIEEFGDDADTRQTMFSKMESHFTKGKHTFGLYCGNGRYYLLVLKDEGKMDVIQDHSDAWKHLDVTILHKLVLEDLLGIDKEKLAAGTITGGSYVEYIKAIGDAVDRSIKKIDENGYQAVFFMNPTRIKEVEEVATNHETMPQKSTFFYPKVYTGLVVNKI